MPSTNAGLAPGRNDLRNEFLKSFPSGTMTEAQVAFFLKKLDAKYFTDDIVETVVSCAKEPGTTDVSLDAFLSWLYSLKACSINADNRGGAPEKAVPEDRGSYMWIMRANEEIHRAQRRLVSEQTQRAIDCGGYVLGDKEVKLTHIAEMLENTRFVSPSVGDSWPQKNGQSNPPLPEWTKPTTLTVEKCTVIDASLDRIKAGKKVAAVNAASAYHTGGGFTSGGRHALEESMCEQSTLYCSLAKAAGMAHDLHMTAPPWSDPPKHKSGSDWDVHVPQDGVILSPLVEVFRGGTLQGYPFEDTVSTLEAMVSVAMPNCNGKMSDSPLDASPDNYEGQVEEKWRATLTAAAFLTQADCLVVPDAGCGVFQNPPEKVGEVLGRLLRDEFRGRFDEVLIAFPGGANGEKFAESAVATFGGNS